MSELYLPSVMDKRKDFFISVEQTIINAFKGNSHLLLMASTDNETSQWENGDLGRVAG